MRFQLSLLAVFALMHSVFTQSVPHDIHCNFQYLNGNYNCLLNDVNIITETVPLRFFNIHLPNHNDSDVTGLDTLYLRPRNISVRVVHQQLIQQFPNLQIINFADSQIEALATGSFERCDELISLTLNRNQLTSIPPRIFQNCTKLRSLDLRINSLWLVDGESFFGLQNLVILQMGSIMLSNETFEHLPLLQELSLTNTGGIESNALRHLSQLEIIEISDNSLSLNVIQSAIDGMKSLQAISLNRNGYTSFDFKFFEQFDKLKELYLIGNRLTTIPENSFKNYQNLKGLRLNTNLISTLTEESFAGLHNLELLTLHINRLSHLSPNTFSELINLKFLDLSHNIIPQIDPNTFNGLQNLETLFLNNIQLSNLTSEMLEPLQNIQILQIHEGNIKSIPPNTFTATKNLRELHLGDNLITRLNSNSFGYLPLLNSFLIGNTIWEQGINEIERNFFKNFPTMVRFGGYGNICFNGIVDITLIDFVGDTEFDQCFSNWDGTLTTTTTEITTTTTEITTTESSNKAVTSTATLWLLIISIVIKALLIH